MTVYESMAVPPLLAGAVQLTVADALPAVAVTPVGAPGAVVASGVTVFDAAEKALDPIVLNACTLKLTGVPAVSPVTTRLVAPAGAG